MNWDKLYNTLEDPYDNFLLYGFMFCVFLFWSVVLITSEGSRILLTIDGILMGISLYICIKEYIRWKSLEN